MNRDIACALLDERLQALRRSGYAALRSRVGELIVKQVAGPDRVSYQLEILIVWDAAENGAIRLLGSIDDGSLSTFVRPLTRDELIDPDDPSGSARQG
jgi:hypothetical protein